METTWCSKETVTPKMRAITFRTFPQDITSMEFLIKLNRNSHFNKKLRFKSLFTIHITTKKKANYYSLQTHCCKCHLFTAVSGKT